MSLIERATLSAWLVCVLALGSAFAGGHSPALPDADCVQLLRRARVAEMRDDPSTALALLQQAARDHPGLT